MIDKFTIKAETLKDIGDAVRTKRGHENYIPVSDLAGEILKIESTEQKAPYTKQTFDDMGNVLTAEFVGVAKLPDYHFYQNGVMTEMTADDSMTSIGDYVFQGDTALASVTAPGLKTVGEYSFDGCAALSSLDLDNVEELGKYALNGCTALHIKELPMLKVLHERAASGVISTGLSLPECTSLEANSVAGLGDIEHMYAPSVETMASNTFNTCEKLKELYLPRLYSMGNERNFYKCDFDRLVFEILLNVPYNSTGSGSAFRDCAATLIDFGYKCEYLSNKIFRGMTRKPRYIIIRNEDAVCELQGVTEFSFDTSDPEKPPKIMVPESMVDEYKDSTNWVTFSDMIESIEDNPDLCEWEEDTSWL